MPLPDPRAPLSRLSQPSIDAAFIEQVRAHPDRVALTFNQDRWTYGRLDLLSGRLATLLAQSGVKPGDVVAIVSSRNATLVCAILAVMRAGATFAIVDVSYPPPRIDACLALVRPSHVLSIGDGAQRPALSPVCRVTKLPSALAELAATLEGLAPTRPTGVARDGIAYLSFTSGSTGNPKCIATGHAPLPHFIDWHRRAHHLDDHDACALLSGVSHDPLLRDIFTPLSLGATLHVPQQDVLLDPGALFDFVSARRISILHLTPQLGRVLMAGSKGEQLPSLRWLAWGGDVLTKALLAEVAAVAPQARNVNFYGTTETPQAMGHYEVVLPLSSDRIPLGKGIDDVQLLVLDDQQQLAPIGAVGELVVRTPYLSLGYLGDSAATASKYITNPFTGDPSDTCYRTGDRASFLPDGSVEFRGRADDQVKIRGYRVELGEVAAILRRAPGVGEVQLLARTGRAGDLRIVAFVCPNEGTELRADALAAYAQGALPSYMQPASYSILPELPRLPNGKVDRQALLQGPEANSPEVGHEEQQTESEARLARLWAELLGVPRVSIHESFYDLGGDSLTAVQLLVRMRSLGLDDNSGRLLLQGRTIAEIARGDARAEGGGRDQLEQVRLVVNLLRGLIVLLVILDHWFTPLTKRVSSLGALKPWLGPLLNWPTPGFAIVFGITLGFVYHPVYQSNPARLRQMCKRGAAWVGVASLMHLAVYGGVDAVAGHVDWFWLTHSAMHYYLLAMLSVPAWLALIGRTRRAPLRAALLAGLFLALHYLLRFIFPGVSVPFLLGKYAYLNLSAGVLLGVLVGLGLRRRHRTPTWYLPAGVGLVVAGVLSSRAHGQWQLFVEETWDVEGWKWVFYSGLTLLSLPVLQSFAARALQGGPALQRGANTLATIGQLAFPMFVLDFVSRKATHLFDILGASPALHPLVALSLFTVGSVLMIRKTYSLFYGKESGSPGALPAASALNI